MQEIIDMLNDLKKDNAEKWNNFNKRQDEKKLREEQRQKWMEEKLKGTEEENKKIKKKLKELEERMDKKIKKELADEAKSERRDGGEVKKREKKTSDKIKWVTEEMERKRRRKNIILQGEKCNMTPKELQDQFVSSLSTKVEIRKTWKITGIENTLGIQLGSTEQKEEVMKKKTN